MSTPTSTPTSVPCLCVDAGGSTTRVGIYAYGGLISFHEGASCNPTSVGADRASANLRAALHAAWIGRPHNVADVESIWCGLSSASSKLALHRLANDVRCALPPELASTAVIWIANDIAPLLVHDGRVVPRVVAICGTGTGFCALNPSAGVCARASGHEYLLSDEGGGFDIGLQGLRAVMRAWDERGLASSLTSLLRPWRGVLPQDLPSLVHSSAEPKVLIASFARYVLQAADQGDEVAVEIVERAASELALGVLAVARRAGLEGSCEIALAGSNLVSREHPILQKRLRHLLARDIPGAEVTVLLESPLEAVAQLSLVIPQEPELGDLLARSLPFGCFHPPQSAQEDSQHA